MRLEMLVLKLYNPKSYSYDSFLQNNTYTKNFSNQTIFLMFRFSLALPKQKRCYLYADARVLFL